MANLQDIIPAFFTGPNGEQLTPDQIAQRQQVAKSLLSRATDTRPDAGGWASVLNKALMGGMAGYDMRTADDAAALNAETDQANIEAGLGSIFGGGLAPAGGIGGAFPSAVSQGASPTSGVATGTGVSLPGDLGSIINDAASRYNVDPAALSVIAQIESGGNVNARNPNSSAGGPFQFIDSTAKQYGLKDRFDPVQASDAAARLTRDNAAVLTKALGRAPTVGELYLAHQQGSGGASKLLSNPNARAVDIVGRDAVRLNGGDENMTALSFANKWINKADRLMGAPQQAIQAIAPIEQGDGNPAAGIAPIEQTGNAYVDPIVAPVSNVAEPVFNQDNFSSRLGESQPLAAPIAEPPMQQQQQPQIDPRLAALNDQMLGGALSPTGRSAVAQALTGYFPEAPGQVQNNAMSQAPMQQPTGGVNPRIIASLLGPNSSPQARQVGALLIGQHQQQQDPMRQLQMQKMQEEVNQMRRGLPSANSSFGNLDAQAKAAGLMPGTPEYQQFMLNGGGAPATFRALDMQARAAGFQPGSPEYNEFMATRGAGLSAGAAQEAKNQANISSGGTAAGVIDLAEATIKAGVDAWSDYGKLQSSIGNIEESIRALDSGAKSGAVYKMLPNVTEASASLQNAMDRMGLDVIGSVTFGALSEGEMRLAMNTAVPRDLAPAELRSWLVRKLEAQKKASAMLADAARYLTVPGNTINGWIEKNLAEKSQSESQQPSQSGGGWSDAGNGVRIRPRGGN